MNRRLGRRRWTPPQYDWVRPARPGTLRFKIGPARPGALLFNVPSCFIATRKNMAETAPAPCRSGARDEVSWSPATRAKSRFPPGSAL